LRSRPCLLDKNCPEIKKLRVERLTSQMGSHDTKPDIHAPDKYADRIRRSTSWLRSREKLQSLSSCLENWVGRIKTGQLEYALDLAPERTDGEPSALSTDLARSEKKFTKACAGHVVEPLEINKQIDRLVVLGQGTQRVAKVGPTLEIQAAGNCEDFDASLNSCLKSGHKSSRTIYSTTNSSCSAQPDFYLSPLGEVK
jgi:hypothetical protein